LPRDGSPGVIRLQVTRGKPVIGWAAVLDAQMRGDASFGDLRVGSLIDCLASPGDAAHVVAAATRFLRRRGVDLVVSHQAHPAWTRGLSDSGFVVLRGKRVFAAAPALGQRLEPFERMSQGLHLTAMDGLGQPGV
jgi:hypothetical protein